MKNQLPECMTLQDYVIIDEYPLKENGKLDRERLEEMYRNSVIVKKLNYSLE